MFCSDRFPYTFSLINCKLAQRRTDYLDIFLRVKGSTLSHFGKTKRCLRYPISVPSRSARRKPRGRELGPCRSTTSRIYSFGRPKRPLEAYPHASTRAHRVADRQRKQPRGAFSSHADPSLNVKRRPRDQHVPAPEAREIRLAGAYTRRPDPISVVDEPRRERGWFTYGRRE